MLLPALVLLLFLIVYPFVRTVELSFMQQKMTQATGKFIGFKNYSRLLGSSEFWTSFGLSVTWTVTNVIGQVVFGVII